MGVFTLKYVGLKLCKELTVSSVRQKLSKSRPTIKLRILAYCARFGVYTIWLVYELTSNRMDSEVSEAPAAEQIVGINATDGRYINANRTIYRQYFIESLD